VCTIRLSALMFRWKSSREAKHQSSLIRIHRQNL
jgi:hypothetical protein